MSQSTIQQTFDLAYERHQAGRFAEAQTLYRQILARQPDNIYALRNLGVLAHQIGRDDTATELLRRVIAIRPNVAEVHNTLGSALRGIGQPDEAIAAYRKAIALRPDYFQAYNNLGIVLADKKQFDAAIVALGKAIERQPDFPEAHGNLGNVLKEQRRFDEAIAEYTRAIALKPDFAQAHVNLGSALISLGRLDESIKAYRRAIALNPNDATVHSKLILALQYHPSIDAGAIAQEHRAFNRQHAAALAPQSQNYPNHPIPDRRLRVGYVSADFSNHTSAHFLVPLLQNHDPQRVEIFAYAHVPQPDDMTRQLRELSHNWRSTVTLSDEQMARQIRDDRIDILVDLKLHTGDNRLLVFARKPAPVQVSWLGYPASTGIDAIDYHLRDPYLDPAGADGSVYSEHTIRLPHSFWCYDPLEGREIPVSPLPAQQERGLTFGCLNNFCKVNDVVLDLWARVMRQVENSRLLVLAHEGSGRQHLRDKLAQEGIGPCRIEFASHQPHRRYLELYHRIDVGLDTFPYNGHTTTCDASWMGVPTVSLVGQTGVGRGGLSILSNLALSELVGHSQEQYARIAIELARDIPRLIDLRANLRRKMQQSPLMDAPRFARNIEAAYRLMWHTWCKEQPGNTEAIASLSVPLHPLKGTRPL